MHPIVSFLAQMDYNKFVSGQGTPDLSVESSYVTAWIVAAVLAAGILLITFKTSRRNQLETD